MAGIGIQLIDYDLTADVVYDSNGQIALGIAVGDTTPQNQAIILQCHQGEIKENPALGVGIDGMLLENDPLAWRTTIREQMELDGQKVDSVTITTSSILIDAKY